MRDTNRIFFLLKIVSSVFALPSVFCSENIISSFRSARAKTPSRSRDQQESDYLSTRLAATPVALFFVLAPPVLEVSDFWLCILIRKAGVTRSLALRRMWRCRRRWCAASGPRLSTSVDCSSRVKHHFRATVYRDHCFARPTVVWRPQDVAGGIDILGFSVVKSCQRKTLSESTETWKLGVRFFPLCHPQVIAASFPNVLRYVASHRTSSVTNDAGSVDDDLFWLRVSLLTLAALVLLRKRRNARGSKASPPDDCILCLKATIIKEFSRGEASPGLLCSHRLSVLRYDRVYGWYSMAGQKSGFSTSPAIATHLAGLARLIFLPC